MKPSSNSNKYLVFTYFNIVLLLQLQSLAFGSATEGKKKAAKATNSQQQNGGVNGETGSSVKPNQPPTDLPTSKEKNGNIGERPKGISQEQWEQWQKRDNDVCRNGL